MKIVSFTAAENGLGKTTLTYNFGEWLADQKKHILLIDADPQCSLSQTYNVYQIKSTIADIFTDYSANLATIDNLIYKCTEQIDLLPGSNALTNTNDSLQTKADNLLIMQKWFKHNQKKLNLYDYVLIDCGSNFSIIDQNMFAVSDQVYSLLPFNEYGFDIKNTIKAHFDLLQKKLAKNNIYFANNLLFLINRMPIKASSEIINDNTIAATIFENDLLNKSTLFHHPLVALIKQALTDEKADQHDFLIKLNQAFTLLLQQIIT